MQIKPALLMCALMAAGNAAYAQAPPGPTTPMAETAPPSPQQAPKGATVGQAGEPLGDKLARSDGVMCPPTGVDPLIRAPTPDTADKPVIPPPGSPGGDPNLRPK